MMSMKATGGRLLEDGTRKETVKRWNENGEDMAKKSKYKLPSDWNFRYHHAVDDHNNLKHAMPPIEDTWVTDRWNCRVFDFILAITEVNAFLILH